MSRPEEIVLVTPEPPKLLEAERVVVPAPLWVNPPVPARALVMDRAAVLVAAKLVAVMVPDPSSVALPNVTAPLVRL